MNAVVESPVQVQDEVHEFWMAYQLADAHRTDAALQGGEALLRLKAQSGHGNWGAALEATGVPARTARRWMRLSKAGMTPGRVGELGGLVAADEWVARQVARLNGGEWGACTCFPPRSGRTQPR